MADSIAHQLRWAKAVLLSDTAALDAEILLAFVLDKPRSYLFTWPESIISISEINIFRALVSERQQGKPIAYLLGVQEFWSLLLKVTPATLIPRPETEQMIDAVLLGHKNKTKIKVLDAGTGSGAIAIALAKEKPEWSVYACDYSLAALRVARENAIRLNTEVHFFNSNWLASLHPESIDILVSNPPYIAEGDNHLSELKYEPQSALVSAQQGLADVYAVVGQSRHVLKPGGALYIEHGYDQAEAVQQIFTKNQFAHVITHKDYAGCDRFTSGVKN